MISLTHIRRTTLALAAGNFSPRFCRVVLATALCCADHGGGGALWKKHFAKREPLIAKFQTAINREIGFAKSDVLRKLARASHAEKSALKSAEGRGAAFDFLFDLDDLDAGLRAAARSEHAEALQTAGNELFEEIESDDVFTMPPQAAKDFIETRENLLSDVSQEIFDSIKAELQDALDAGESLSKIAARIEAKFGEIEEGRAATVASTEVSAAYGFARDQAMKQAGIEYKQWLGSGLPNMRDTHREASAEGQTVALDEPFTVGGEKLMYPGDPAGSPGNVINCHCVSIPVETPEGLGGIDAEETEARDGHGSRDAIAAMNIHHGDHGRFSSADEGAGTGGEMPAAEKEIAVNIERGRKAMAECISKKTDMPDAMEKPGVGKIGFFWGHKGGGVCHIIDKRDREGLQRATLIGQRGEDVAMTMPEVIARGKLSPPFITNQEVRRTVDYKNYRAILSMEKDKRKGGWLLSGFEKV